MINFKNAQQFKDFIKKQSKILGISIPNAYRTYVARCFLERLSKYNDHSILLKGSSAELTYMGKLVRAITDIDVATIGYLSDNYYLFEATLSTTNCDIFSFNMDNKLNRTQTGIFKINLNASFDKINQSIGMDIQENYNRLIEPKFEVVPAIFDGDNEFKVLVPSYEEFLAEKLCIVAENNKDDVLNTRVKDFYDIYQLHGGKYDSEKLTEYFFKILKLRGKISIDQIRTSKLNSEFIENHIPVWESAKKKYDFIDKEIDLEGAVYYTRAVLREQLQKNGQDMTNEVLQYKKI